MRGFARPARSNRTLCKQRQMNGPAVNATFGAHGTPRLNMLGVQNACIKGFSESALHILGFLRMYRTAFLHSSAERKTLS